MKLHELDATALLAALAKGETSSVEIVQSLIERRKSIGEKVSAIVLPLDDSARKAAEAADAARKRGDTLLPLHGLPVSIKDNFEVIGTPATLGVVRRRNHHSQQDAVAVAALNLPGVVGTVNFAGGSGGYPEVSPGKSCKQKKTVGFRQSFVILCFL